MAKRTAKTKRVRTFAELGTARITRAVIRGVREALIIDAAYRRAKKLSKKAATRRTKKKAKK